MEIVILSVLLVAILVCNYKLMRSLKLKFHGMYQTHKLRLNLICGGLVTAVSTLLIIAVLMQFYPTKIYGPYLIIGHAIGSILPITAYVLLIDATEDCFDCFNRSKDLARGAQVLSVF